MSADNTTPDEMSGLSINWNDDEIESTYANIATATATREEFFLLFGTHQNWRGMTDSKEIDVKLSDRMVLSPFAAKRMAIILNRAIKVYEDRYGVIGGQ